MEGVKFIDLDRSQEGPRGLLNYLEVWCVLGTNGDRFHVSSHYTTLVTEGTQGGMCP